MTHLRSMRRALTAGLAGAALYHGGATAGAQVPDSAEVPAPAATATPTPTPTPTPEPESTPTAQPEPTAVPSPVADTPSGEDAPAEAPPVAPEPEPAVPSSSPVPTPLPTPTTQPAPAPEPAARQRARRVVREPEHRARPHAVHRTPGAPAPVSAPPGLTVVVPGVVPAGVPDFFIDRFRIPPFLLPIYQAAGSEYGVRWEVLAAINEIESDYGRNLAVSRAGAAGWMQFMPSTWRLYGVDANGDGVKDPYNPFDAIFAAARYLRSAGADRDLRGAIFAYNHADWYVESVMLRARVIGGMPSDLVGSLSGLVDGRFPVRAEATYARRLDLRIRRRDSAATARLAGPVPGARPVRIYTRAGAPVIAVHDARVAATGGSADLGRYMTLRDAYGNRFTYGRLAAVPGSLRRGARVAGGQVLGRVAAGGAGVASHLSFRVRPAGRSAPWIDPTPLLDGWKLLESSAINRAAGRGRLLGLPAEAATAGQILLMDKGALARRVLADPHLEIYGCGRRDIEAGRIDRRVLATLAFLAASGLRPTVTALECGHGVLTASGNVSEHSTGTAVDIAAVNGVPIVGHQGAGSITDITIQRLLTLQGAMKPHQIISAMRFEGADNTFAMGDHADHIHIGWRPAYGAISVDAMLAPKQWVRLIDRLGEIDNPVVTP